MRQGDLPAEKRKRHNLITSKQFHDRVFAMWGSGCWFCGMPATDAMHIISRWQLGLHRYCFPEINGRPGCRRCHNLNTVHELFFTQEERLAAIRALNTVLTVPINEGAA